MYPGQEALLKKKKVCNAISYERHQHKFLPKISRPGVWRKGLSLSGCVQDRGSGEPPPADGSQMLPDAAKSSGCVSVTSLLTGWLLCQNLRAESKENLLDTRQSHGVAGTVERECHAGPDDTRWGFFLCAFSAFVCLPFSRLRLCTPDLFKQGTGDSENGALAGLKPGGLPSWRLSRMSQSSGELFSAKAGGVSEMTLRSLRDVTAAFLG